jgi:hypothetical protein
MFSPSQDTRSASRKELDERIAAEPLLPPLDLNGGTKPATVEAHLAQCHRPLAVAGIVENGLVRPLDPDVRLPEHSRVIIVASQ